MSRPKPTVLVEITDKATYKQSNLQNRAGSRQ